MFKAAAVAGFLLASAVPAMASAADDVIVSVVPNAGLAASALLAHDFDKAARKLQAANIEAGIFQSADGAHKP